MTDDADTLAAAVVADMPGRPMGERLAEAVKRAHGETSARLLAIAIVRADAKLRAVRYRSAMAVMMVVADLIRMGAISISPSRGTLEMRVALQRYFAAIPEPRHTQVIADATLYLRAANSACRLGGSLPGDAYDATLESVRAAYKAESWAKAASTAARLGGVANGDDPLVSELDLAVQMAEASRT